MGKTADFLIQVGLILDENMPFLVVLLNFVLSKAMMFNQFDTAEGSRNNSRSYGKVKQNSTKHLILLRRIHSCRSANSGGVSMTP